MAKPGERQEEPGPSDSRSAITIYELHRAAVWFGVAIAIALVCLLAQPLMIIFGALVLASMLDGGTRLLGRILPIARSWRLLIICLCVAGFFGWTSHFAGQQITNQAHALKHVIEAQINNIFSWAQNMGIVPRKNGQQAIAQQLMGSVGQLTSWVGTALGALSSLAMIVVLGIFIAAEPRLYERGLAWLLPIEKRAAFYHTTDRMGHTLRRLMAGRLLGMTVEGVGVGVALGLVGVPMAALLGILTGILAFLPNIGAIISGILIVLVGFSAGVQTGIWATVIYVSVQMIDGYVIVPAVARRSVDLAPALILGMQLLLGTLLGIVGLALADPIVAMIKVFLEERAHAGAEEAEV